VALGRYGKGNGTVVMPNLAYICSFINYNALLA